MQHLLDEPNARPDYNVAQVRPVKPSQPKCNSHPPTASGKPQPWADIATLAALAPKIDASSFITVRIRDLEQIFGKPFPAAAHDQSGWWVRHLQTEGERAWLSPCWWIEDFDLVAGQLVVRRIDQNRDRERALAGEPK